MTIKKTAEIGVEITQPGPKPVQAMIDIAHVQTFPFLKMKFVETNKKQSYEVTFDVSPTLYKFLTKAFDGDEAIVYVGLGTAPLGFWGDDMMRSIRLLVKMGMMSPIDQWLGIARERISQALNNEIGKPVQPDGERKRIVDEAGNLLKGAGILSEIEAKPNLLLMAKDVIVSGRKDLDTAIYRVAMAIYHSKVFSARAALESLEDPGQIYLNFVSSEAGKTYPDIVQAMQRIETPGRSEFVRTFMCFVVGVYLCNKALV